MGVRRTPAYGSANFAKVGVVGSNPIARSRFSQENLIDTREPPQGGFRRFWFWPSPDYYRLRRWDVVWLRRYPHASTNFNMMMTR